ncbi:MAG: AAA family ATPase [Spirochaetota bacterium]|nr:MAG: AAA family ATPase [Spirochaetota bacterium]
MDKQIQEVQERINRESKILMKLKEEVGKVIVGQDDMIEKIMIGLISNGHLLIEGVPGLAKTLTVSTFAHALNIGFKRIQFTPDMLPADLIGTMVYNQRTHDFQVKKGPIFSSFILADEINRAPAKTQSALLEAMQERQVTIGEETFKLDSTFLVIATQNPIEQYGTYPLPEAQVDRFMMKLKLDYPSKDEELSILNIHGSGKVPEASAVIKKSDIERLRSVVHLIYMDEKIEQYIVDIVTSSRKPDEYELIDIKDLIAYGASPRASLYLKLGSKANAFLNGRGYVIPDDIRDIGYDILRHRLILTYEAQAEDITTEDVIEKIFSGVEVP